MRKKGEKQVKSTAIDLISEEKEGGRTQRDEFGLSDREKAWANMYLRLLNKKETSLALGSPEGTASNIGCQIYSRPHVKKFIADKLREDIGSPDENVKKIQNMRDGNIANYMVPVVRVKSDLVRKSLRLIIKEIELEQEMDDELMMKFNMSEEESAIYASHAKQRAMRIAKMQIELQYNPAATKIVAGPEYLATEYQVDISKVIADKESGIIKSFAHTPNGIKIEMPSPLEAAQMLARINGSFEKDNTQSRPHIPTAIQVNIIPPRED